MSKLLCIESPYRKQRYMPWTLHSRQIMGLSPEDAEELEAGETVFVDNVAFSLEDLEDEDEMA